MEVKVFNRYAAKVVKNHVELNVLVIGENHGTSSRLSTFNWHYISKCCTPVQYNKVATRLTFSKFD